MIAKAAAQKRSSSKSLVHVPSVLINDRTVMAKFLQPQVILGSRKHGGFGIATSNVFV